MPPHYIWDAGAMDLLRAQGVALCLDQLCDAHFVTFDPALGTYGWQTRLPCKPDHWVDSVRAADVAAARGDRQGYASGDAKRDGKRRQLRTYSGAGRAGGFAS